MVGLHDGYIRNEKVDDDTIAAVLAASSALHAFISHRRAVLAGNNILRRGVEMILYILSARLF